MVAIGDLCRVVGGGTPSRSRGDYFSGDIPWATVGDMNVEQLKSTVERITCEAVEQSASNVIPSGNVIIATRVGLGKVCLLAQDTAINQDLRGVIPLNRDELSERYLYWWFRSISDRIIAEGTGATVQGVKVPFVKSLQIPVPPMDEQQRIIAILDEAFEGIAVAKANAEQNAESARGVYESKLDHIFTTCGSDWAHVRLGDICERVSVGHVGPTTEFYCDAEHGVPLLRSQNVRRGRLDLSGVRHVTPAFHHKLRKSQLKAGDLLFVRVGANRGDCCSVPQDVGEINCANIVFARPTEGNAAYLARYCDSAPGRTQLLGMSVGSAQGVINTGSVAELVVPLAPEPEQNRIVDSLDELHREAALLEAAYRRKAEALKALKKSLLNEAFSGNL